MPPDQCDDPRMPPETTSEVRYQRPHRRRSGINGNRLGLNDLNSGEGGDGMRGQGRWARFVRALEQFLAGMYTGESCAGTPRDPHESMPDARKGGTGDKRLADHTQVARQ